MTNEERHAIASGLMAIGAFCNGCASEGTGMCEGTDDIEECEMHKAVMVLLEMTKKDGGGKDNDARI